MGCTRCQTYNRLVRAKPAHLEKTGPTRIQPGFGASAAAVAKALFKLTRLVFCAAAAWAFAGSHKEQAGGDENGSDHVGGLFGVCVNQKNSVTAFG